MRERIWRDDVSLYVCFCLKWPLAHLLLSSLSRAACLHPSASVETSDCTSRPLLPGEVVIAWLNLRSALIGREIGTHGRGRDEDFSSPAGRRRRAPAPLSP